MDVKKIITTLQSVTSTAGAFVGPLAGLGVPYAGLVKAGLDVATTLEQHIVDGLVVATSDDHAQVKQIITDLQAENDRLAAAIAAS